MSVHRWLPPFCLNEDVSIEAIMQRIDLSQLQEDDSSLYCRLQTKQIIN